MQLNYLQPSLYERFAEIIDDEELERDFQNLVKLIAYVRDSCNLEALTYSYQIAQDVNIYVMPAGAEDLARTSQFGASFALAEHEKALEIENWIDKR